MLIYLVPGAPRPNVFFTVSLTDPCEYVPLPSGWATQLHSLHADELDVPPTVHALDKATWLLAIIAEVTFDLTTLTVSCTFTDGPPIEWPLDDAACVQMLEDVLSDVAMATDEMERERARDKGTQAEPARAASAPAPAPTRVPIGKPVKHKKQRSLLMSLVSSINKLTQSVCNDGPSHLSSPTARRTTCSVPAMSSRPPLPPPSKPLPPPLPQLPAGLPPSTKIPLPQLPPPSPSVCYQHRARSQLVEVFRSAIIPVLRSRMAPGGYRSWAAQNMLQRTEEQMAALVQDAGGVPALGMDLMRGALPSVARIPGSPCFDDEFDDASLADSVSTDTDGSSVHTPVDSPSDSPFGHLQKPGQNGAAQQIPRTPTPPTFSPEELAAYTALSAQCLRLRQVLTRAEAAHIDAQNDERAFLAVLEVKSRRRAWSNCAYLGGAHQTGIGFATPFRSSPLARCEPITPTRLATMARARESRPRELDVCTGEMNVATLFPVSEEDEDDEVFNVSQKGAYVNAHPLVRDAAAMQGGDDSSLRPQIRSRTLSMHTLDLDLVLAPDSPRPQAVSLPPPPALHCPPPSLNFNVRQAKPLGLEPQTKFALFEQEDHPDRVLPDKTEFTLAMDLAPPPPYSQVEVQAHAHAPPVTEWDGAECR